ncbi:hypothetical protein H2200_000702 [Cladophialophora chaetospira]|uniref:CID domain-containing protein n=1 Tax=Cladophialophora chaetospira TaxID=386627 RepID=A0AA38XPA5_9EURO|nr:hypothetical protein H2200_000702 [Cladophialophora chaetospira]
MAAHIAIAKAAFGASLLRPDVTKVSRNDLPTFHDAFEAMLLQCSSRNIQTCKRWLLENVIVSAARTAALGKYLATTSKHLAGQQDEATQTNLSRRQRLHILYLVNDLLHHGKYHTSDTTLSDNLAQSLPPFLVELCRYAGQDAKARVSRRLADLMDLWREEAYLGGDTIAHLQNALNGARHETLSSLEATSGTVEQTKEPPYVLPSTHGDDSVAYYDLPAANLMHHIVPNSSQPMRPAELHALQLSAGPADEKLVNALKNFLKDVEGTRDPFDDLGQTGLSAEMDELGQVSYPGEDGDLVGDTYYGWSRAFCEKMKRGRQGSDAEASPHGSVDAAALQAMGVLDPQALTAGLPLDPDIAAVRGTEAEYSPDLNRTQRVDPAGKDSSTTSANRPLPLPLTAPAAPIGMPFPPPPPPFVPAGLPVPPPRPLNWTGPWPPPPPPPPPLFPQGRPGYHSNLPLAPPPPPPNYSYPPSSWPASGQNNQYSRGW